MRRASAQRNNRITPAQLKKLQVCWRQMCPALADDRDARITFAASVISREISSYLELSVDEAGKLIEEIEREIIHCQSSVASRPKEAANVFQTRNPQSKIRNSSRSAGAADAPPTHAPSSCTTNPPTERPNATSAAPRILHGPTEPQKFLIVRLQRYLNKDTAWLEEFLKKKFRQPKLWALTMRQASAAIRLLLEFASRRDIKLRLGQDHKVSKAEINAEIPKIKAKLF